MRKPFSAGQDRREGTEARPRQALASSVGLVIRSVAETAVSSGKLTTRPPAAKVGALLHSPKKEKKGKAAAPRIALSCTSSLNHPFS